MSPRIRETLYKVGTAVFTVVTLLATFHIIDPTRASVLSSSIEVLLGLFGVTLAGTATYNVRKQRADGTFDDTPPATQVINGLDAVLSTQKAANAAASQVWDVISNAIEQGSAGADSLVSQIRARVKK